MEKTLKTLVEDSLRTNKEISFYVMPTVGSASETVDPITGEKYHDNNIMLTYIVGNEVRFYPVKAGELDNSDIFMAGRKFTYTKVNGEIKGTYREKLRPVWKKAFSKNKTEFCFGQSILISALPGNGKTTTMIDYCKSFDEATTKERNVRQRRILFGERDTESAYDLKTEAEDLTIHCLATKTTTDLMREVHTQLTLALKDAYDGKDAVFALDSATRMVIMLSSFYTDSHMVSGGLSSEVNRMVSNTLRMAGHYGKGSLTVIQTCLYAQGNNTWRAIYQELSAAANAEVKPAYINGKIKLETFSRVKEIIKKPVVKLLGLTFQL